jgi:hypothetical protein
MLSNILSLSSSVNVRDQVSHPLHHIPKDGTVHLKACVYVKTVAATNFLNAMIGYDRRVEFYCDLMLRRNIIKRKLPAKTAPARW